MNEDALCHYGVLGMKWGRKKASASKNNKKKTKKASKDNLSKDEKAIVKKASKLSISEVALTGVRSSKIARDLGPLMGIRYAVAETITTKNRKKKNAMYKNGMYDL